MHKASPRQMVWLTLIALLQTGLFWGGCVTDTPREAEARISVELKPGDPGYPTVGVRVNQEGCNIDPRTGKRTSTQSVTCVAPEIEGRSYMGLLVKDLGWQVLGLTAENEETPGVAHVRIESDLPVRLEVLFLADGDEPPAKVERRLPAGKYQLKINKSGEIIREGQ